MVQTAKYNTAKGILFYCCIDFQTTVGLSAIICNCS